MEWTANNAHRLFRKKSFIFPIKEGKMDCKIFVKKPMGGYFERCLPSIPVKKKIS
jgi:hypothetical protein